MVTRRQFLKAIAVGVATVGSGYLADLVLRQDHRTVATEEQLQNFFNQLYVEVKKRFKEMVPFADVSEDILKKTLKQLDSANLDSIVQEGPYIRAYLDPKDERVTKYWILLKLSEALEKRDLEKAMECIELLKANTPTLVEIVLPAVKSMDVSLNDIGPRINKAQYSEFVAKKFFEKFDNIEVYLNYLNNEFFVMVIFNGKVITFPPLEAVIYSNSLAEAFKKTKEIFNRAWDNRPLDFLEIFHINRDGVSLTLVLPNKKVLENITDKIGNIFITEWTDPENNLNEINFTESDYYPISEVKINEELLEFLRRNGINFTADEIMDWGALYYDFVSNIFLNYNYLRLKKLVEFFERISGNIYGRGLVTIYG